MSTDAVGVIELMGAAPLKWAEVWFRRDYRLFDLLAGGRSGDPRDAVVPVRPIVWPGADREDPATTWVRVDDLEIVAARYREELGRDSDDARAILATMEALNAGDANATRLVVRFF